MKEQIAYIVLTLEQIREQYELQSGEEQPKLTPEQEVQLNDATDKLKKIYEKTPLRILDDEILYNLRLKSNLQYISHHKPELCEIANAIVQTKSKKSLEGLTEFFEKTESTHQ